MACWLFFAPDPVRDVVACKAKEGRCRLSSSVTSEHGHEQLRRLVA